MITFLKGLVVEKLPTRLVLDVGGVGYEVLIPLSSYDVIPASDQECQILIYDHIREDTHKLFGFMSENERKMFVLLLSISGVGPKLALSALSGLSIRELTAAIAAGDVKRISSISGIGKKMAERIVVDLRDKIDQADVFDAVSGVRDVPENMVKIQDAVMALIALGYKQEPARKMVLGVMSANNGDDLSVENIIKHSLAKR
ncbi:MAG: Holliday junction branch migration protein RuvA [Kiritimatiellae bacterium]|nr:Holliday junction branch migration protein RuvA [Kiritimatiellia bacterium]